MMCSCHFVSMLYLERQTCARLILKGQFSFFEAGLYEVPCITYSGWRSEHHQFGEAAGVQV